MKRFMVEVDVALKRPPRVDETRWVSVVAEHATEASLTAAQISSCTSVMPVGTRVISFEELVDIRQLSR